VEKLLPGEVKNLKKWCSILPLNDQSPVHPFGSVVINFNAATRRHQDCRDYEKICLVLVIKRNCTGGDLVLEDLGVVLDLENGDVVIFRSADITHFNMDFKGERASLVLHSDGAGKESVEQRNGWEGNKWFKGPAPTYYIY